jgi:hypothetical protein
VSAQGGYTEVCAPLSFIVTWLSRTVMSLTDVSRIPSPIAFSTVKPRTVVPDAGTLHVYAVVHAGGVDGRPKPVNELLLHGHGFVVGAGSTCTRPPAGAFMSPRPIVAHVSDGRPHVGESVRAPRRTPCRLRPRCLRSRAVRSDCRVQPRQGWRSTGRMPVGVEVVTFLSSLRRSPFADPHPSSLAPAAARSSAPCVITDLCIGRAVGNANEADAQASASPTRRRCQRAYATTSSRPPYTARA